MVFYLGTHFEECLSLIQPPAARLEAAQELPRLVRDYLQEHKSFLTLEPHSRLVGSYAQHTSVGDVKDVDFLVRAPGKPEANEPEAKKLLGDLKRALDDLPKALGYAGLASIDVEGNRRSVHVYFEDRDFHLDVVPCIAPRGFDEVLYVPDRGLNEWVQSHPVGYIHLLEELTQTHGEKFRQLLKLFKHFRNIHMQTRRPKSYWLGALVVHHVRRDHGLDMSQSLAVLFRDLLDAIYCQYDHLLVVSDSATPNIPDPMLNHNISWNWGRSDFETFMRRLDEGRQWAAQALEEDDREAAIRLWQKVLGEEYFPTDVSEEALRQALAATPGRSFVSALGSVAAGPAWGPTSTKTKPTTFYGRAKGTRDEVR
jgi:hypothetical protein